LIDRQVQKLPERQSFDERGTNHSHVPGCICVTPEAHAEHSQHLVVQGGELVDKSFLAV